MHTLENASDIQIILTRKCYQLLLGRGADPTLRGNTTKNGGFTESGLDPMLLAARGID